MRLLADRSIAVRLALSSVFWSGLVLLVAGLILSTLYRQSVERGFDDLLLVIANDLAADLATPGDGPNRPIGTRTDPRFEIPLSGWYWQAHRPDASQRAGRSSRSLLGGVLPQLAEQRPDRPFGDIRKATATGPEGRSLRVLERDIDLGEDGRYVVRVAGPAEEISLAFRRFMTALAVTFFLVGTTLGLTTLLQIRFGLRPLSELREAVASVRRAEAERIPGRYPSDIAPLARELNLLLDANREILDRARTQVGNLAHALKTPLSVITNEADQPTPDLPARVREQAGLMRDQVQYYLDRARAAALAGTLGAGTEVAPVLEGLGRAFRKIHPDREVAIKVEGTERLRFRGERQDLEEMAGNLMDNACKWARARVVVTASLGLSQDRPVLRLVVEDDGPGVPEAAWQEAVRRGRRLDESKPGSGLGLAIVSELAGLYGGRLSLCRSAAFGGARAELELPGDG